MGRIRSRDTSPEIVLRSLLHRCGYRFSLASKMLPGKPDIVLPKYKAVVFVQGCFWHRHGEASCKIWKIPKSNVDFWEQKLAKNVARDQANIETLSASGWHVLVAWECEVLNSPMDTLKRLLGELEANGGKTVAQCLTRLGPVDEAVKRAKERHKRMLDKKTGKKQHARN